MTALPYTTMRGFENVKQGAHHSYIRRSACKDLRTNPPPAMPTELIEHIIRDTWLDTSLFDPLERWKLFATLSLVDRRVRQVALRVVTRHVKVLGHCSMDIAAYSSIGRQQLVLGHTVVPFGAYNTFLKTLYQPSTIELDITYACHWVNQRRRNKWLEDSISPGRPDDESRGLFDVVASPDALGFSYPIRDDDVRERRYQDWLSRRCRGSLSGWFAELLAVVPDCKTCVVSVDEGLETFTMSSYAALLESLWWWKSLAKIHFRAVPGLGERRNMDFLTDMVERMHGLMPCLPALPSVSSVSMANYPICECKNSATHDPECVTRRMLLPFPNLRQLRIEAGCAQLEDVPLAPGICLESFTGSTSQPPSPPVQIERQYEPFDWMLAPSGLLHCNDDGFLKARRSPQLKISKNDALWAMTIPVSTLENLVNSHADSGGYQA